MSSQPLIITVTGQIKECYTDRSKDLFCVFDYYVGTDWSIAMNSSDGKTTQTTKLTKENRCVWNYPIDVSFKTSKPSGWPQVIFAVWGHNRFGKDMVVGYGATHIPTTSGHHELRIPLFVPASSSKMQSLVGFFTGISPEFINMKFIAEGQNREVVRTDSQGYISVSLDILMRGLDTLGLVNKSTE